MKVMSIIGIVWFSLSFVCIIGCLNSNLTAAAGWGLLGMLYAVPFAIVGLISTSKSTKKETSVTQELVQLFELKEKGILSEDEFQAKKIDLLKM